MMSIGESLEQVVATMHRLLRGEMTAAEAAKLLDAPEDRLATYQRFVFNHVRGAIEKNYTILAEWLDAKRWEGLVRRYFAEYPPADYELNAAAEAFPAFLAGLTEEAETGVTVFHVELALFEWHEWRAYSAEEEIPKPEEVTVATLNPTISALQFTHPVASWATAYRRGDAATRAAMRAPMPESETVIVFRHPETHDYEHLVLGSNEMFSMKVIADGIAWDVAAAEVESDIETVTGVLTAFAKTGAAVLPRPRA